jgi:hypothetical protein
MMGVGFVDGYSARGPEAFALKGVISWIDLAIWPHGGKMTAIIELEDFLKASPP